MEAAKMEVHDLVRMANQIAGFFSAYPHDEAVKETLYHLEHFWDPRMRYQLVDYVARTSDGLDPIALEAAKALASVVK
jgi:formate dehydrogenase subunit delta